MVYIKINLIICFHSCHQVEDEIVPYGLADDMLQHGLEDEILQDGLHSGGDKEQIIQGRLERLKAKLKYIFRCLLKKQ